MGKTILTFLLSIILSGILYAQPSVKILSPNGAEHWLIGSIKQVILEVQNAGLLNIEYSTNSGQTWQLIGSTTVTNLEWIVPNTPSLQCKVRAISSIDPSLKDESDNIFNILSIPGIFNIQFNYDVPISGTLGNGGVVYIPGLNEFWVYQQRPPNWVYIFSKDGSFLGDDGLNIHLIRGLAYDGTYVYAINGSKLIFVINPTSRTLVDTIVSTIEPIAYFAYDPTADEGNGGFWIGDRNHGIDLINRQGLPIGQLPTGASTTSGMAYDNYSPGGPYLWLASSDGKIKQRSISFWNETGLEHDISSDIGLGSGDIFIAPGIVNGTATIGGVISGNPSRLYGYKLCDITSSPGYYSGYAPGLIDYWKLDETSGAEYADVIGSNNAFSGLNAPIPSKGIVNGAQQFNGTNSQININANPLFDIGIESRFTIEFWIKREGNLPLPKTEVAVGRFSPNNFHWWAGINASDGKIWAEFFSGIPYIPGGNFAGQTLKGNTVVTDGNWHHVVVTRSQLFPNLTKLYVDGNVEYEGGGFTYIGFISQDAPINVGWLRNGDHYLNGSIDELAFYTTVISDGDIKEHYKNGLSGLGYFRTSLPLEAPIITSTEISTAQVNNLYTYDVNSTGVPEAAYSLVDFPSGMTINSLTGIINWVPTKAGNYNVIVDAHNGVNPPSQQSFIINVEGPLCPNGMISYWKLDETGGSTYKDEQGINDASSLNIPSPDTGQVNGAQQFNGTSNKISAPSIPLYDFAVNSSFTFEAWILYQLPGSFLEERVAVGRKDEKSGLSIKLALLDYSLQHAVFSVRSKSGEYYEVIGKKNLNDGKWHHMVGVKDGSLNKLYLYVDGIIQNTISTKYTSGFDSPTATLDIGFRNIKYMNDYFAGCIDEVAVYNIALDAASITQHYINGLLNKGYCEAEEELPACPQSLISLWKLDESSGSIYYDYTGNNNASGADIPVPVPGRVSGAQQFNGTSDKITAPRIAAYDFSASSSFTFETWLNHASGPYTGEEVIIERKSTSNLSVNLKFNSNKITFSARNITGQLFSVTGTKNLWDGKWHHVAGMKDGINNQLRIYVDGVLENTVSAVYIAGFASSNAGISIGWRNKAGDESYFKGSIDEAAIYNSALDAASIIRHYSNGLQNKGYCQAMAGNLTFKTVDIIEAEDLPIPTEYKLLQNYPNPFNPSTKISFSVPKSGLAKLTVYNVLGKEIAVLVNEEKAAGNYEAEFNALNLPSGIYFYRLQTGDFSQTRKMLLLK